MHAPPTPVSFHRVLIPVAFIVVLSVLAMLGTGREEAGVAPAAAPRLLWIPPNTYTSIVVVTTAQSRRWVVALSSNDQKFPIALAPGATVVIPFERGWVVRPENNAHIIVDGVVTGVSTDPTSLTADAIAITAWGVTPNGPVAFVTR